MAWRDMTEQEAATRPEARLGGALLWVVLAAVVVCLVAIGAALLAFDQLRSIGIRYMIAVGFAGLWSAVFVAIDPAAPAGDAAGGKRGLRRLDRLALRRGAVERGRLAAGGGPVGRGRAGRRFLRLHGRRGATQCLLSPSPSGSLTRYKRAPW